MREIVSDKAPQALGFYSQGIEEKGFYYFSMQIGISAETGKLTNEFSIQMQQIMENLSFILEAAELSWENVISVKVYLQDISDFGKMNEIYGKYVRKPYPAREVVAVNGLPRGAKAGISLTASK